MKKLSLFTIQGVEDYKNDSRKSKSKAAGPETTPETDHI
jgi:hypothetical protein